MRIFLWVSGLLLVCIGVYLLWFRGSGAVLLPEGVVTQTGILQKTEISITRRGSHLLLVDGEPMYLVESKEIHLGPMEGKRVALEGEVEHNIDEQDLPVFVVSGAELMDVNLPLYQDHQFGYRFPVPMEYLSVYSEEEKMMRFVDREDQDITIIALRHLPIPADQTFTAYVSGLFPDGVVIQVGGYPAWQSIDATSGGQRVLIDLGTRVIDLSLTPPSDDSIALHRSLFLSILASFEFDVPYQGGESTSSTGSDSDSSKATASGIPCGGPAGILCPEGEYCNVTDFAEGIGRCEGL